jgi:hypothetical protein
MLLCKLGEVFSVREIHSRGALNARIKQHSLSIDKDVWLWFFLQIPFSETIESTRTQNPLTSRCFLPQKLTHIQQLLKIIFYAGK